MPKAKKSTKTVSKKKIAQDAEALEVVSVVTTVQGVTNVSRGVDTVDSARNVAVLGAAEVASGAADMTRGIDASIVAERMGQIGQVVKAAGAADISQGAEMLASSDDLKVMSAIIGLLGADDLERGLTLARVAGELRVASDVVDLLNMPILSAFLDSRGDQLQESAVDVIVQLGSMRALSQAVASTSEQIYGLGRNEVQEGMIRLTVAKEAEQGSEALAERGADLTVRGAGKMMDGAATMRVARDVADVGIGDIARGSGELGMAAATDATAEALEEEAE